jgi:hypothetical protein
MPSLWLGWWWRGESDSGFEQKFAYLLPDKIAHPGGGDIPCEQLDRMRPRPFSLLVGALTAGPTAEGWRPAAGTDLEPLFADRAPRRFAPSPFWSSGCHPEGPSMDFVRDYASDEMGSSRVPGCGHRMARQLPQPCIVSCGSEIGRFSEIAGEILLLVNLRIVSMPCEEMEFMRAGCVSLCSGVYWRACQRRNLPCPSLPAAWKRARPNLARRTSARFAMSQGHSPRTRGSAIVIDICWSKCRPRRMALTRGKTNWRRSADGDFM